MINLLERAIPMRIQIDGVVEEYLNAVTTGWLLPASEANPAMLEMFSDRDVRPYRDMVPWAGEFAGKYLTSAVQVLRLTGDPTLQASLAEFVTRLVARQDADGYLGPWPAGAHLTGRAPNVMNGSLTWDAWGHYHVLLGLLLWSEQVASARLSGGAEQEDGESLATASTGGTAEEALAESALDAALRIGDLFCRVFLKPGGPRLVDLGETDKNLAAAHSEALLYRRTGQQRYLDLALQLVDEFAAQGPDGPLAGDWFRLALAGQPFYTSPKPRWESLHAILALVELYRATGEEHYRQAFENLWWSIVEYDRHNNGGFTAGEQATGNPYDPGPIETCCTVAWMAASVEMLKLESSLVSTAAADELELSLNNAVLGMHSRSGRWACYNTPSDGARFASAHQIVFQARSGSPELNCCSVNSPRGLGLLSEWALLRGPGGLYLNYYGSSTFTVAAEETHGLPLLQIRQETDYPLSNRVRVLISPLEAGQLDLPVPPVEMSIFFRVPGWSRETRLKLNGQMLPGAQPGRYLEVHRAWQAGDVVEIEFDFSPRLWSGERECAGLASVYRGPLLLAFDPRYNRGLDCPGSPETFGGDAWKPGMGFIQPPALRIPADFSSSVSWDDWLPPLLLIPVSTEDGRTVLLCDFASAGQTGTPYRSWLPVVVAPPPAPFSRENPFRR